MFTFSHGNRTAKLMVLYMLLSTGILLVCLWRAPEQLNTASIAIGSLGAGATAFKFGNGFEARSDRGKDATK